MSRRFVAWAASAAGAVANVRDFVVERFQSVLDSAPPPDPSGAIWEEEPDPVPAEEAPGNELLEEAEIRSRMGDPEGAIASLQTHLLKRPGDDAVLVRLARLKQESGDLEAALRICRRLLETEDIEPKLRDDTRTVLFSVVMQRCRAVRQAIDEALVLRDPAGALAAVERQITQTVEFFRLDPEMDERMLAPIAVSFNHALATKAFLLWVSGRRTCAESELVAPRSQDDVLPGVSKTSFEEQRFDMFTQLVAEHGRVLFDRGDWKEAGDVFRYAKGKRLEALKNRLDDTTAEMYVREAMCEYNTRRYRRAQEILTHLIRRAPNYRNADLRALRDRAHQAEVAQNCQDLYRKAASAFRAGQWESAITLYRETANFLEQQEGGDFRAIAAECYYNAAMSHWNRGDFREARNILHYLSRAYPDYETTRVVARLRELDQVLPTLEALAERD